MNMNPHLRVLSRVVVLVPAIAIGCNYEATDKTKVLKNEIAKLSERVEQLEKQIEELKTSPKETEQDEAVEAAASQPKEPRFEQDSLELTAQWCSHLLRQLELARASANEIRLAETKQAVEDMLQATVGQHVSWQLAISSVTEQHVYVQQPRFSSAVLVLWTSKGENNGDRERTETSEARLQVGTHISREQAASLSKGDAVTLHGSIENVQLATPSRPQVRFELKDVTARPSP